MTTTEERVSYIEGRLDSLATKSDLYQLETRLVRWMIGLMITAIAAAATIALVAQRLTST